MKGQRFLLRLGFALDGLRLIWAGEASFRSQVRVGLASGGVLMLLRPSPLWIALVLLAAGLVLTAEAINAAIEHLCDTLHPALHPGIKATKDAAAAGVLIASLTAVGVAAALAYRVFS